MDAYTYTKYKEENDKCQRKVINIWLSFDMEVINSKLVEKEFARGFQGWRGFQHSENVFLGGENSKN